MEVRVRHHVHSAENWYLHTIVYYGWVISNTRSLLYSDPAGKGLINPSGVELLVSIYYSSKAGIANVSSSFKWQEIYIFMKNKHLPNITIWLSEHHTKNICHFQCHFVYLGTSFNPCNAEIFLHKLWRPKFFSIWNHHKCFRFIWIPMLWHHFHYKYFTLSVHSSTLDIRIWRLQTSNSDV